MEIHQVKIEMEAYIRHGKTKEAIEFAIQNISDKDMLKRLNQLSSRFHRLKGEEISGTLYDEDRRTEYNRINLAVLSVFDYPKEKRQRKIFTLILLIILMLASIFSAYMLAMSYKSIKAKEEPEKPKISFELGYTTFQLGLVNGGINITDKKLIKLYTNDIYKYAIKLNLQLHSTEKGHEVSDFYEKQLKSTKNQLFFKFGSKVQAFTLSSIILEKTNYIYCQDLYDSLEDFKRETRTFRIENSIDKLDEYIPNIILSEDKNRNCLISGDFEEYKARIKAVLKE